MSYMQITLKNTDMDTGDIILTRKLIKCEDIVELDELKDGSCMITVKAEYGNIGLYPEEDYQQLFNALSSITIIGV